MQRDEEALIIDCQQYCLEHMVNRLYDLEPPPQAEEQVKTGEMVRW